MNNTQRFLTVKIQMKIRQRFLTVKIPMKIAQRIPIVMISLDDAYRSKVDEIIGHVIKSEQSLIFNIGRACALTLSGLSRSGN